MRKCGTCVRFDTGDCGICDPEREAENYVSKNTTVRATSEDELEELPEEE